MKRNITMFSVLWVMALSLFTVTDAYSQNCIPAGPRPVHATTVSGGIGTVVNITNINIGDVIMVTCPAANLDYNFNMCATNSPGWTDGTNDSRVTVLDVNDATATSLGGADDGCPDFAAGQNGWGPTNGNWVSPAAGTYYFYVTEWGGGNDGCDLTGNTGFLMDVTISNAATCASATVGTATADATCVEFGDVYNVVTTGTVVPGANPTAGFTWIVTTAPMTTPTDPYNDPAYLGTFGLLGDAYPVAFTNDGTQIPAGTYYFTAVVLGNAAADLSTTDPACTFASASLMVEFMANGALCGGGGIDCTQAAAGTIVADDCTEFNATWNGTSTGAVVPGASPDAGFMWALYTAAMTTPTDPLNDPAFLGAFGVQAAPSDVGLLNDGTQLPAGVYYAYTITFGNGSTDPGTGDLILDPTCTFVSNGEMFELKADGASCTPSTCTAPTATASYDCATSSIIVDVTDMGTPSAGSTGFIIDINGTTQDLTAAGQYSFPMPPTQTYTIFIEDGIDEACNVIIGVFPDCMTPCTGATEGLTDGDFEGAAGSAWTEVTTDLAGTPNTFPIVDAALPLSGLQSGFFGGYGGSYTSLEQTITIPANTLSATLTFWTLEFNLCAADNVFTVTVDGNTEFTQAGDNATCGTNEWYLQTIDLSAYADGNPHTLIFNYDELNTSDWAALFVDLASLEICPCPMLTVNGGVTGEQCGDATGMAEVTDVPNGTAPYTYAWNTGATTSSITGLSAGDYTVTVTDANGCTGTAWFSSWNAMADLDVQGGVTGELCGDATGMAEVTSVTGGPAPYTYVWSNGATGSSITGLSTGDYTVTVTNGGGCTGTAWFSVWNATSDTALDVMASATGENCGNADGTAMVDSTTGGSGTYSYMWSNGMTTASISGLTAGTYNVTVMDDMTGCSGMTSVTVASIGGPNAVYGATDVTCPGAANGTISLTVAGGLPPYEYMWSNGMTSGDLTGLSGGTYTCTVTDEANACPFVLEVVINEPTAFDAQTTINHVTCNGGSDGSFDITVTGGTMPYSYSWSNGSTDEDLSGLMAGEYVGTITDANGCEAIATIFIEEPDVLAATADAANNVSCNGLADGSIEITVTGGTPPYTYAWSNGATTEDIGSLAPGDYSGTITDANGCELVAGPITITQPDALDAQTTITHVSCNGGSDGSFDITVTGGTMPYTYSWSNGSTDEDLSGLMAGEYVGTVTDANGCEGVATIFIEEPAEALMATVDNSTGSTGADGMIEITVSGGTAPYSYSWTGGSTDEDPSGLAPGDYSGTITDANGCEVMVGPVNVWDAVSVDDLDEVTSFSLTPNPTSGDVYIQMTLNAAHDVQVELFDVTGRVILTQNRGNVTEANFNLDLGELADGVYMARFIVDGKASFTERIVKTK